MKLVRKNNRQLRIADDRLPDYLEKGYEEIDAQGRILSRAADPAQELKRENKALAKENRALKNQVDGLKTANDALSLELAALKEQLAEQSAASEGGGDSA